jgi:hypothetical protein
MIYLIDDKKQRQINFGWNTEKLSNYAQILQPIYSKEELDNLRETIFSSDNTILFHDSFFDNPINKHDKNSIEIRQELIKYASREKRTVVFFSGSIASRNIEDSIAYLPVEILYNNLEVFCQNYIGNQGVSLINIIVYGKDYAKEEQLIIKNNIWNLLYDCENSSKLIVNQKIINELDRIKSMTGKEIDANNITIHYFKYRINEIFSEYNG